MQTSATSVFRAVLIAAFVLADIASASPFIQLGPKKSAPEPSVSASKDLVLSLSEPDARAKIDQVMTAEGFGPSDAGKAPSQMSYVKFGDAVDFHTVAECQGLGVGTPKLWIETLILDVHSDPQGVHVATQGQFQVLLSGLISGKPFKLLCHSRGVLESQVNQALSKS